MRQLQYVLYMFMTFIPWTTSEDCSCNEFINSYGFGQCKRIHPKHGHICFVNTPSNCDDLMESMSNPEMSVSASACNSGAGAGGGAVPAIGTGAGVVAGGEAVAETASGTDGSCTDINGRRQEDGSEWIATDGCNRCKCGNGVKGCTRMLCIKESIPVTGAGVEAASAKGTGADASCTDGNGRRQEHGSEWLATDGCNACKCVNGVKSCSKLACEAESIPGTGAVGGDPFPTGTGEGPGAIGLAPFPTGTGEGVIAEGGAIAATGTEAATAPLDVQPGSQHLQIPDKTLQKDCCGRKKYQSSRPRVVHGRDTDMNEYPWIARLQIHAPSGVIMTCGGSLIASQWILTAHHCLEFTSDPNSITAVLGDHVKSTTGESDMEKGFQISKILNYGDTLDWAWDISLLKLSLPVNLSIYTPICLPEYTGENKYIGKNAWVVGWGALASGGNMADTLQKAKLEVVSNVQCEKALKDAKKVIDIVSTMICAGSTGQGLVKDSCQGDSGGPLAYSDDGIYDQIGIVSQGFGCAITGLFGVYAYVAPMKEWIEKIMLTNGGESLPSRCSL